MEGIVLFPGVNFVLRRMGCVCCEVLSSLLCCRRVLNWAVLWSPWCIGDSKISFCRHVSLWTWGVAGDTLEEGGLTGRKMNAMEYVWTLRSRNGTSVRFWVLSAVSWIDLTIICPFLEFLISFPLPPSSPQFCLRHIPHCLALLEPQAGNAAGRCAVSSSRICWVCDGFCWVWLKASRL